MHTENFYCKGYPETKNEPGGFQIAVRNRERDCEVKNEELWVFAWLGKDEAKELLEYLKSVLD